MTSRRTARIWTAALLLAAAATLRAAPAAVPEVRLSSPGPLRPGQSVAVTWSALPAGTEEFELLLQCDAPVPVTLRLTESEDPSLGRFSWRVPAVPCGRARLVLRRGEEGEERLFARSAPFAIRVEPTAPVQQVVLRDDEYWVCDGAAPAPLVLSGSGPGEGAARREAARENVLAGSCAPPGRPAESPFRWASPAPLPAFARPASPRTCSAFTPPLRV